MFSLEGRQALVTGGASGIGLATARLFAEAGANVTIADVDASALDRVRADLATDGLVVDCAVADVSDERDMRTLGARAIGTDILVCNAGIEGPIGSLAEASSEAIQRVLTVNLMGAIWLTGAVVPAMAARGRGSVILMASIAAVRGNRMLGAYGMSKAALAQLARNLAVEWGPLGVRSNSISPGLIRTPFAAKLLEDDTFRERRLGLTPLRRAGEPAEIAGAALFLASDAGGFVNGHNLVVDGGTVIADGN